MIELLGIAAGGSALLITTYDLACDSLPRRAEVVRVLSALTVSAITTVRHDDRNRINAWLSKHAGTTELSETDREFFRIQLELAERRVPRS